MAEHRYAPVNRCIYCGADKTKLCEEHIIPFSLDGSLILPAASCRPCEKITHTFEFTVARRVYGNFRIRHNLQTRRPKERPTHLPMLISFDGGVPTGTVMLLAKEHPAPIFQYLFGDAGFVAGLPPNVGHFQWNMNVLSDNNELQALGKKYGGQPTFQIKTVQNEFARLIAKICHAYVIAICGLDSFRPLLLDIILGRSNDFGHFIGGSFKVPAPEPTAGHMLSLAYLASSKRVFVLAHVRLFANIASPVYYAIVGEIDMQNTEHVAAFRKQTGDDKAVELPLSFRESLPAIPHARIPRV